MGPSQVGAYQEAVRPRQIRDVRLSSMVAGSSPHTPSGPGIVVHIRAPHPGYDMAVLALISRKFCASSCIKLLANFLLGNFSCNNSAEPLPLAATKAAKMGEERGREGDSPAGSPDYCRTRPCYAQ
jgi:hypothetical protein